MTSDGELPANAYRSANERRRVPYRGRVRTGCVTCRSRKIKCDEARPSCSRCIRSGRECVYRPIKPLHRQDSDVAANGEAAVVSDNQRQSAVGPSQSIVPSMTLIMETVTALSKRVYQDDSISTSLTELVSRDIQITTTMDLLAIDDHKPLIYFLEEFHCPAISTYDPDNWIKVKTFVAELAKMNKVLLIGIHALQTLHKSQTYGLPVTNAVLLYRAASEALQQYVESTNQSLDCTMSAAFLLALFEIINYEIVRVLREPSQSLVDRFREWHQDRRLYSPNLMRMGVWLRILHVAATRAGGPGLVSASILESLPSDCRELLTVNREFGSAVSNVDGESLFSFYFDIEMISSEVTTLAHYYRSRVTTSDQQEVAVSARKLRLNMDQLWQNRPSLMTLTPMQLQQNLPHATAQSTVRLIGILIAAYHGQRIEIGRVLSNPRLSDQDVIISLTALRDIIDGDWSAVHGGRVSCGYLRPLLLHAVESFDSEQKEWAVAHMRMIRDPIYRSDFFAAFAKATSEMQLLKDRRVTMRYFCIQTFGVQPPFL